LKFNQQSLAWSWNLAEYY